MLVITMGIDELTVLYDKSGRKIGEVKLLGFRSGDKARIGFEFSVDEVAIAKPGTTAAEALSICNSRNGPNAKARTKTTSPKG